MKNVHCLGVSSRAGNKHILMLDLDHVTKKKAERIAREIQEQFNIGDIILLRSSANRYHLISLDKLWMKDILPIIAIYADPAWVEVRSKVGELILRVSGKGSKPAPKFCAMIKAFKSHYPRSNAHRMLLNRLHNLNLDKTPLYDDKSTIIVDYYRTLERNNG